MITPSSPSKPGRHHHGRRNWYRAGDSLASRRARRTHRRRQPRPKHLEEGTATLRHAGLDPLAVQIDVRKPDQVDEMIERVLRHFGRIDILVNNAAGNFISEAEDLSPNGWNAVVGIVLNGSFYCSRAVGRQMIARGRAARSSPSWQTTSGPGVQATHSLGGAKTGVMSMTQTLAVEWAPHNIRVNAACTGANRVRRCREAAVDAPEAVERITRSVPLGRWGQPLRGCRCGGVFASSHASLHHRGNPDDRRRSTTWPRTFGFV